MSTGGSETQSWPWASGCFQKPHNPAEKHVWLWQWLRSYLCRNKGNSKWCTSHKDCITWTVCLTLTCGRVFLQVHKCTGEHSASRWHLTRQKRGVKTWEWDKLLHYILIPEPNLQRTFQSVSVKHRGLLEMRRILLSIINIRRVLASSHSSEISGRRQQRNWALPTHESKQLLIGHYLSQTYCSVRLLSPSVSFSSVHVACLCYFPLERIPWPCKAGLIYMRINSRLYSLSVFHSLTFCWIVCLHSQHPSSPLYCTCLSNAVVISGVLFILLPRPPTQRFPSLSCLSVSSVLPVFSWQRCMTAKVLLNFSQAALSYRAARGRQGIHFVFKFICTQPCTQHTRDKTNMQMIPFTLLLLQCSVNPSMGRTPQCLIPHYSILLPP